MMSTYDYKPPEAETDEAEQERQAAKKKRAEQKKARAVLADLGVTIGYANGKGYLAASRSLTTEEAEQARKAYRKLNA